MFSFDIVSESSQNVEQLLEAYDVVWHSYAQSSAVMLRKFSNNLPAFCCILPVDASVTSLYVHRSLSLDR